MLTHVRRFGAVLTVAIAVVLVLPNAAFASGRFRYTFLGDCCINTRHFTTVTENDIWLDVDTVSPCNYMDDDDPGHRYPGVKVGLYQSDALVDTHIGNDKTILNCFGDVKWSMVNPREDLYFKIVLYYPHRDSRNYTVKGTVAYDGAVT